MIKNLSLVYFHFSVSKLSRFLRHFLKISLTTILQHRASSFGSGQNIYHGWLFHQEKGLVLHSRISLYALYLSTSPLFLFDFAILLTNKPILLWFFIELMTLVTAVLLSIGSGLLEWFVGEVTGSLLSSSMLILTFLIFLSLRNRMIP